LNCNSSIWNFRGVWATCQNFTTDGSGIFGAGVIISHDNRISELCRDFPHDGTTIDVPAGGLPFVVDDDDEEGEGEERQWEP
jgi:hypothetical protein